MLSVGAMVTDLDQAYENEQPIIVTGWSPHWKFASYDLKYLDDPLGAFGDEEYIATMVRKDLEADMPEAYQVLEEFYWTPEDMEEVMLEIDRKSTRLNSSHVAISYAVFCLKKKKKRSET